MEGIDSFSKKKTKSASSASVSARLDGTQNSSQDMEVGGITVVASDESSSQRGDSAKLAMTGNVHPR